MTFVSRYNVFPSDEYQEVVRSFNEFKETRKEVLNVTKVEKVVNSALNLKFEATKMIYQVRYGDVKVFKLFHGTKSSNISSILVNNFDHTRHGQSTGHRFGAGVSFSAQASYASHYSDKGLYGQMLYCEVLIAHIIQVPEMKRGTLSEPPYLPGGSGMRYDTTAKSVSKMDVVVKWNEHEYVPQFVIHFERKKKFTDADSVLARLVERLAMSYW